MTSVGMKWLITTALAYAVFLGVRYAQLIFSDLYYNQHVKDTRCCDEREVDISDSRLSNFGSDSGPHLDSSELAVDRAIPLTSVLNRAMNKICRKFSLYVQLEDKKILFLKNHFFNLTFFLKDNGEEIEKNIFGMDAVVSRLDSLQRLGNAYVAENTDSTIVLIQRFRLRILKYKYDYYDEGSKLVGRSSFIFPKNTFTLNITLSFNYDNRDCKVSSVNITFIPDKKSCLLKLDGILGTAEFYAKLESVLYEDFTTKVVSLIKQEMLPMFNKIIQQADLCSYFNAGTKTDISVDSRDFLSAYIYDT